MGDRPLSVSCSRDAPSPRPRGLAGRTGPPHRPPAVHGLLAPVGGLGVPPGLAFPKGLRPALGPERWVRPGQMRSPAGRPKPAWSPAETGAARPSLPWKVLERGRAHHRGLPPQGNVGQGHRALTGALWAGAPAGHRSAPPPPRPGMRCSRSGGPGGSKAHRAQRGRGCQPGEQRGAGGGEGRGGAG